LPKILSQHTPTTKLSTAMARNPRASYLPLLPPSKNQANTIRLRNEWVSHKED
jgi:hypothetical protein